MKRKEDFLNQLQYKIGDRWEDMKSESIQNVNDLKTYILNRNAHSPWAFLDFLPFYFDLKDQVSTMVGSPVNGDFDLNQLNMSQRKKLEEFISKRYATPLTLSRPKMLHQFVYLFPLVTVLGSLLLATYLITALDYSGLWYLTAALGLILSIALFEGTKKFKQNFKPATILEYAKAFLVVNHQQYTSHFEEIQLENFITEELSSYYNKPFTSSMTIG